MSNIIEILQHSLGLDQYGRGTHYRNHFVTSPQTPDWPICEEAREKGLMVRHEPKDIFGGSTSYCFCVTDAGKRFVRENGPVAPKLTRGQKRYREFLDCDGGETFGEWLKRITRPGTRRGALR